MTEIINIFALIFLGYLLKAFKILDSSASEILNNLLYYLFLPTLAFYTLSQIDMSEASLFLDVLLLESITLLVTSLLSVVIHRKFEIEKRMKVVSIATSFYGNTGYMGIPLVEGILGREYLPLAMVLVGIHVAIGLPIFLLILSEVSEERANPLHTLLRVPILWGIFIGLLWALLRLPPPEIYFLHMISFSTSPLALISLGIALSPIFRNVRNCLLPSFLKLVMMPFILYLLYLLHPINYEGYLACLVSSSVPVSVSSYILSFKFRADYRFATEIIVFSTILSLVTIPIMLSLLS